MGCPSSRCAFLHPEMRGSTYGSGEARSQDCRDGVLEGDRPSIGDCVVLQTQGESSILRIESSDGCGREPDAE
jgi:hypothetical protein